MDDIARRSSTDRADMFRIVAEQKKLNPSIIEKDFWVCWVLRRVFALPTSPRLLFKGGTSLSKVYGIIDRFSEDVDLAFDRDDLGFGGANDPAASTSSKKQQQAVKSLIEASVVAVKNRVMPQLAKTIEEELGVPPAAGGWRLELATDEPCTVLFEYPTTVTPKNEAYIASAVRLEFGARSDQLPAENGAVVPYAAEVLPKLFKTPSTTIRVLAVERTFWEKATLLHQWFHAPAEKPLPPRQSRHYYDLARLCEHPRGRRAMENLKLLAEVARFKQVYFAQAWAKYDLAVPPTLKLVPPNHRLVALNADYRQMREMFFAEPPTFDALLDTLAAAEQRINQPEH